MQTLRAILNLSILTVLSFCLILAGPPPLSASELYAPDGIHGPKTPQENDEGTRGPLIENQSPFEDNGDGSRGGGDGGVIMCSPSEDSSSSHNSPVLWAFPYATTKYLETSTITTKDGKEIDFKTSTVLKGKKKRSSPPTRMKYCMDTMWKIQKRLQSLSRWWRLRPQRHNIAFLAKEMGSYLKNLEELPKTQELTRSDRYEEGSVESIAVSYSQKKKIETPSPSPVQLANHIDSRCDRSSFQMAFRKRQLESVNPTTGRIVISHEYEYVSELLSRLQDGNVDDSEADLQCSFLYIHEFLRQFLEDSSLIDFYTKFLHSETFFSNAKLARNLLSSKNEGYEDLSRNADPDDQMFHIFNPFGVLNEASQKTIWPDLELFFDSGRSYYPNKNGHYIQLLDIGKVNVDSEMISVPFRFDDQRDKSHLRRRKYSTSIFESWLVQNGQSVRSKESKKVYQRGDLYLVNGEVAKIIGFGPVKKDSGVEEFAILASGPFASKNRVPEGLPLRFGDSDRLNSNISLKYGKNDQDYLMALPSTLDFTEYNGKEYELPKGTPQENISRNDGGLVYNMYRVPLKSLGHAYEVIERRPL